MSTKPAPLLQPFKGVLPAPDKAHLVATRSYLTYSDYELKDKLSRNPYSYLHVIHPDGEPDATGGLSAIRSAFEGFLDRGWLRPDPLAHYYVLQQRGPRSRGISRFTNRRCPIGKACLPATYLRWG
jgi:uncharacterized protein (DUF1015 family)